MYSTLWFCGFYFFPALYLHGEIATFKIWSDTISHVNLTVRARGVTSFLRLFPSYLFSIALVYTSLLVAILLISCIY